MAQQERYKIHLFSKTRRLSNEEIPSYKFSELPKLNPIDDSNYCAHLYTENVSVGLIETQTLVILGEDKEHNIKPISQLLDEYSEVISEGWKIFLFIDTLEQENLRFFTVDKDTNTIKWSDRLLLDPMSDIITAQVGFIGDKGGQYENNLYICEIRTEETDPANLTGAEDLFHVGTIKVYSSAVEEDERYRNFFENFGIPDPISYMDVFMDNEEHGDKPNYGKYDDKIDYDLLNQRSKQLFLSYHEIFPYIGTYKALINAVDILGYNDIYFKEWYRELTEDQSVVKYTTYEIPYKNSHESKNIITTIPIEKRVLLKKLNWLTMVYKISEEALDANGIQTFEELEDNVRIPIIQQNYKNYEANEILVKLIALKKWLEKNIIGINCRIIDINGEGLVVERYKFRTFAKTTSELNYYDEHYLTPYVIEDDSSLLLNNSKANISLGLKEQYQEDNEKYFYVKNDDGTKTPIYDHFVVRASLSSKNSALSSKKISENDNGLVSKTLLIQDGEIIFDPKNLATSTDKIGLVSEFNVLPLIQIEKARLRNPNLPWKLSTIYDITNDVVTDDEGNSIHNYKIINIKTKQITTKEDVISLKADVGASLKYTSENKLNVPLFIIENFKDFIIPDAIEQDRPYILELLDGKFVFNENINGVIRTTYLNFHFDTDENEQNVEVNYVYSVNIPFSDDLLVKDEITGKTPHLCDLPVCNTGTYSIYVYGMDNFGLIHGRKTDNDPTVFIQTPEIELFTTHKNSGNSSDFFNINTDGDVASYNIIQNSGSVDCIPSINVSLKDVFSGDSTCVMREQYLMNDVSVNITQNGNKVIRYATYPTISYSIDTPKDGDFAHFMNIVDNFEVVEFVNQETLKDESYPIHPDSSNTYDYNSEASYVLIWLRRNDTYEANVLNDGIERDGEGNVVTFPPVRLTNIVVYDNLHSEAFYEDMCYMNYGERNGEMLEYIIMQSDAMDSIVLYYKNNIEKRNGNIFFNDSSIEKYPYSHEEKNDSTSTATLSYFMKENEGKGGKVYIDRSIGIDVGSIQLDTVFQEGKLFKIYAQPAYEIPVSKIVSSENKNTVIFLKDEYCPNMVNLFSTGKKIKLIHKTPIDDKNILISQNLFTCSESTGNTVTVDSNFPYNYEESSENNSNELTSQVYLSYAHNAFVDYVMIVDHSKELINGYTELYVKDDTLLKYVDNTFCISNRNFDVKNVFDIWMKTDDKTNDAIICNYAGNGYDSYIIEITKSDETNTEKTKYRYKTYTLRTDGNDDNIIWWVFDKEDSDDPTMPNTLYYNTDSSYVEDSSMNKIGPSNMEDYYKVKLYTYSKEQNEMILFTEDTIIQDILLYRYRIPVTLSADDGNTHIILSPVTNGAIPINAFNQNNFEAHCRWRIFKYNTTEDKNELLFESWNTAMFITPTENGIYSVELTLFDEYGNMASVLSEGLFKVKDLK
jgi:hypothetical protein